MNGLFFWGNGKSRDFEYQQSVTPKLDDGKIEVMGTRGVHDMITYRANISHAQRINQCNDLILKFVKIPKQGIALQIDGEAWIINKKCSLRVQIHDKLQTIIGYNQPRGVQEWLQASLEDDKIVKAKNEFRQKMKQKYNTNTSQSSMNEQSSDDSEQDINIQTNSSDEDKQNIFSSLFRRKQEVDITEYVKNHPEIKKDKNNILQSSIFSPKKNGKDGVFLDRFTWWKVTRAKNHDKPIDAETAKDAISDNQHEDIRKTRSFTVLPKRSFSLF